MAFAEDHAEFLDTDDFAVTVSFTPAGGSARNLTGIFDSAYFAVGGGEVDVIGTSPQLLVATDDISDAAQGDTLTYDGETYEVTDLQPDGTGMTLMILEKQ